MKITKEEVAHVARLARLRFTEAETEKFTHQLNDILTHIEKLNELDTKNVTPTFHVLHMTNVFREDEVKDSFAVEAMLANVPEREETFVRVPRIIED
jgi:aspartyl-tRNA(Asn)/glutamyl-tRNA(Gln) amidotransferase subunit C